MHPLPARWLGDVGIDGEAQVVVPDDIGDEGEHKALSRRWTGIQASL